MKSTVYYIPSINYKKVKRGELILLENAIEFKLLDGEIRIDFSDIERIKRRNKFNYLLLCCVRAIEILLPPWTSYPITNIIIHTKATKYRFSIKDKTFVNSILALRVN